MTLGFSKPEPLFTVGGRPLGFSSFEDSIVIERQRGGNDDGGEGWLVVSEVAECVIGYESHFRLLKKLDRKTAWAHYPEKWSAECRRMRRRLRK